MDLLAGMRGIDHSAPTAKSQSIFRRGRGASVDRVYKVDRDESRFLMSGMMRIDPERMGQAAGQLRDLADRIQEIRGEANQLMQNLRECYEGASARAFEDYIIGTACPQLESTSEMCYETARAVEHTLAQFQEADQTLAGTFNV